MEFYRNLSYISNFSINVFYTLVCISLILFFFKYRFNKYTLFLSFLFWNGLFSYFDLDNAYKIFITLLIISIFKIRKYKSTMNQKFLYTNICFALFSISYWISFLIDGKGFVTIISQYIVKFLIPFLFFHGLYTLSQFDKSIKNIIKYIYTFLIIQIVLSILKIILFFGFVESIVGTVQYIGGGTAVVLPILGLLFLWIYHNGAFSRKQWIFVFSLLVIPLSSGKRSPVFIFPLMILLLINFLKKRIKPHQLILYFLLIFMLFYIGVKTNVTLNPEKSTWGSFDITYLYNYTLKYSFGTTQIQDIFIQTKGRGGGLIALFNPHSLNLQTILSLLFGNGLYSVVTKQEGRFIGGESYGIEHEGLMSAATQLVYTLGYIGFILYLLFIYSMIKFINFRKFRMIFTVFFLYDFFLYYNSLFQVPILSFLSIFIIHYSNVINNSDNPLEKIS